MTSIAVVEQQASAAGAPRARADVNQHVYQRDMDVMAKLVEAMSNFAIHPALIWRSAATFEYELVIDGF